MTRDRVYFLGTEIRATDRRYARSKWSKYYRKGQQYTRLPYPGRIKMYAPINKLVEKLTEAGYAKKVKITDKVVYKTNNKHQIKMTKLPTDKKKTVPCGNKKFIMMTEAQLLQRYEAILRDLLYYYSFVDNYSNLHQIMYILKYSLINTLARKLRLNTAKVIKRFGLDITIRDKENKKKTLAFPKSLKKN